MDKKFITGMLSGLLMALAVIGITLGVIVIRGKISRIQAILPSDATELVTNTGREDQQSAATTGSAISGPAAMSPAELAKFNKKADLVFDKKKELVLSYLDTYFVNPVEREKIYDAMLHAMLDALDDPYTTYFSPKEFEDLTTSSEGNYCGIGSTVTQTKDDRKMYIVYPYEGSPALEAGLQYMDEIVGVDGVDVRGWDLDDLVSRLRGEAGTEVTITVIRDGVSMDFTLTRREIELTYVAGEMLEDGIGYILVTSFARVTPIQFEAKIEELLEKGMKSLIIDLRDNGGGMLDACTDMLDLFTDKDQVLVYVEDRAGKRDYTYAKTAAKYDLPVAVLVNQNSASASEVFSGCLQAIDRAKIIGTTSYGKGVVQAVIPVAMDGSGLKITAWKYYTPADICIHGIGIKPDIEVELEAAEEDAEEDPDEQIEAAVNYLKSLR